MEFGFPTMKKPKQKKIEDLEVRDPFAEALRGKPHKVFEDRKKEKDKKKCREKVEDES